jgi:hypothetical protein
MAGTRKAGLVGAGGKPIVPIDISVTNFKFEPPVRKGNYVYKSAWGKLGVPGRVLTHRDAKEQRKISAGTGEHAGHLIAIEFGAPGGLCNLGLQNPNMNTFASTKALGEAKESIGEGGSYRKLELEWQALLLEVPPWDIEVTVTDIYHPDENRPFEREVRFTAKSPSGKTWSDHRTFGNFGSPQQAKAQGETTPTSPGTVSYMSDYRNRQNGR